MKNRVAHAFIALSFVGMAGCGVDTAEKPSTTTPVPVVGVALDRSFQSNKGLVTMLDDRGWPVREGTSMDATILEARLFYDTLGSPGGGTAPLTFEDWKTTFNILPRNAGETLEQYRVRAGVVVYYNKNELGLGRELGCATFDDGVADPGIACYVTNYGTAFRDVVNSLPLAVEGLHSKNTVCISYRPSMPVNYRVQFYTYNGDGDRREWAQLDTLGPRPLPQVCMNCHGGSYDSEKHLAKFARFLPMDPNVVVWAEPGTPGGATRAEQEERIRQINLMSVASPLTDAQIVMLDQLYGGKLAVANTVSATEWAPPAWNDTPAHRQLFDKVVKPNCTTCHAAMQTGPTGDTLAISTLFKTPALLDPSLSAQLCNAFTMPNSQATLLNFWEPAAAPITFSDGKPYGSAAELMLTQLGMVPDDCQSLDTMSRCDRGPDPEELCGNAYSGRACNRVTGACVPNLSAPRGRGQANGVCKTDKTRNCPYPEACVATGVAPPAGLEGYDGVCMP